MYTRVALCDLPTPLQYLEKISELNHNQIYIKRDDLAGPEPGGNKARKLEFILGEAKKHGARHLITCGSTFSNHCRLTAMAALQQGLDCTLVLNKPEDDSREIKNRGNYFLYNLLDVNLEIVSRSEREARMEEVYQELNNRGKKPYLIQGGGYGRAGLHGYVETAAEIKHQARLPEGRFDYLFLATGTGTTQAGLLIGNYLHRCAETIIGISVEPTSQQGEQEIKECLKDYCQHHNLPAELIYQDLILLDDYIGAGYGIIEDNLIETVSRVAREEAILLDPVYTAKAFRGMVNFLKKKQIRNKKVLFLHTGGLPILLSSSEHWDFK